MDPAGHRQDHSRRGHQTCSQVRSATGGATVVSAHTTVTGVNRPGRLTAAARFLLPPTEGEQV
ncbi:hypothetical protein FrCorBMG51_19775 [Protofrankia coriariae]|uniref:Uncharacterized protein n=1 Tax=Protofrankia coriariae TaxID=1562887 RepID=A0ABR5F0J4_9ACTN|nr:hypothetical protein FrCorBMG51_19775 [Protofrankia coriariae]